jgi:hypothetical protein
MNYFEREMHIDEKRKKIQRENVVVVFVII